MNRASFRKAILSGVIFSLLSFNLPEGWIKAGSSPNSYEMGIVVGQGQNGKNAATIKSKDKKIKGFGTLMQRCKPDIYLGKRVKMTAYVRSEKVSDWAGLWLRVDQAGSQQSLSFDNMQDRAIKGTTDWAKYEIVLDVPINASMLAYGTLLSGEGQVWFDKFSFEIVSDSVKPTGPISSGRSQIQSEPNNLDFEN